MKDKFMKNGVFSLEYDKETLKDMVLELQEENQELKKQLETLEKINKQLISKLDRYDAIVDERDELKKQLTTYQILHRDCKVDNLKNISKIEEMENQQKEFIDYLEDLIKQNETVVEVSKYGLPKNCSKLLIDFYKEILSKYKSIIGGKNEIK